MVPFQALHAAIFEELERQNQMAVDAVELTRAVMQRFRVEEADVRLLANPRCVNGFCDE
jgi:hypothetical protein